MLKRGVANERREISSKEFTKKFIKNFVLNGYDLKQHKHNL